MSPQHFDLKRILKSIPALQSIIKSSNSKKSLVKAVKKLRNRNLDSICDCAAIGLKTLRKNNLDSDTLSKMAAHKDGIRFLAQYSKCSKKKRGSLRKKRNQAIVQNGKGIGLLLAALVPIISTVLGKIIK